MGSGSSESGGPESESGDPIDMGMPPVTCSSEWDCGIGERCIDASCVCMGCACSQGVPTPPGTIDEPFSEPEVFIESMQGPDCFDDSQCGPLEYCSEGTCIETTACVDHIECYEDWPELDLFCVDDLCKPILCTDDVDCPDVALCETGQCRWIATLPDCPSAPSFEELIADMLVGPDSAAVVILDLDLDGREDLAVLDDGELHWVMSTGVGFAAPAPWPAEPGTQPVGLGRGDIHGDGIDELLVGNVGVLGVEIVFADAGGPQHLGFVATLDAPELPAAMDVDYDGLPDLVSGTTLDGWTSTIEAQLGDGTGTFGPLWTEDVGPFEWLGPFAALDRETTCDRALGCDDADDVLGARRLDHEGVEEGIDPLLFRVTTGQMIFDETPGHPSGILATMPVGSRGVLYLFQLQWGERFIEMLPAPGEVALMHPGGQTHYAIVEHGVEMAEYIELSGSPLAPVCRGSLGFALDVAQLGVGDFDGDGREDLLGRGIDGVVRVWYSRD
jgi:hypothetical protein